MCRSAVNDGSCSPWVMCSCSVVRGNQIRDRAPPPPKSSFQTLHTRAVVLESGLGLESGLEMFFYRLGLVLDSLVFGLGLVSDLVIGLAKCSSWSRPSPAIYAFFFSFKTKTRLFRKWVM